MVRKHHLPDPHLEFPKTLHEDKHHLAKVQVPIVTISATFKKDIFNENGEIDYIPQEVVFSRAHYSMAVAILAEVKRRKKTGWLVDPTNYISKEDWSKIKFVEEVGKITARIKVLKELKDIVDSFARSKMPISKAITEPLLYVTRLTQKTIVSLHYESGNILAENKKQVLQVVTDPQVHETYLYQAHRPNISFAVFDESTKQEFLQKAEKEKIHVDPKRIVVTGPPVDPRIIALRTNKKILPHKAIRLVIATSGLGTNKNEIHQILDTTLSHFKELNLELFLHAGTHKDFYEMFIKICKKYHIAYGDVPSKEKVRINFSESIIQANQNLIDYGFSWAHGFVTKPSGDMAYDAVGAGCFLLTLEPWGVWEEKIQKIFESSGISQPANVNHFDRQIESLRKNGWIFDAQRSAMKIPTLYLEGSKRIVDLALSLN